MLRSKLTAAQAFKGRPGFMNWASADIQCRNCRITLFAPPFRFQPPHFSALAVDLTVHLPVSRRGTSALVQDLRRRQYSSLHLHHLLGDLDTPSLELG